MVLINGLVIRDVVIIIFPKILSKNYMTVYIRTLMYYHIQMYQTQFASNQMETC